ncbi:MAG: site-specific DNA-methyltransferase, partial [Thiomargarita sp.]|nr:site-specific DNA-methyltransferase [Thiomargarita sp.]
GKTVYAKDSNGQIISSDEKKGVPLSDVWEIPYLNPKAKERVGYPTQKPILLLEQVIEIASNEGDTILDPFCGSGTTLVAGKLKNRKVIGIDISSEAVALTKNRLENPIKSESNLIKNGRKSYQTVNELVEKLLYNIEHVPVHRNSGIDAILKEKYQDSPILIRIQKNNETLDEAMLLLSKAADIKRSKKSFLIRTNDMKALFNYDVESDKIKIIDSVSYKLKKILNINFG